ncbi:ABC transporter substrate-binding protein [Ideonella sp. BN130291]|uniref:ABC transporter substrate-binding protein n=1 Tax=Ideonella sp. BN130291 TaxID=3112940 RepID=UPI002E2556C4|nr:ABC transporter substrate-binding protein [Ideonella sp. BN130291]
MILRLGLLAGDFQLDPLAANRPALAFIAPLYQTLLRKNRFSDPPTPGLSRLPDISADGLEWRLPLLPASFDDGRRVTPRDVVHSLSRHLQPGSPSILGPTLIGLLQRGGSLRADGTSQSLDADEPANTVVLRLSAPYPALEELPAHPAMSIARPRPDRSIAGSGQWKVRHASAVGAALECARGANKGRQHALVAQPGVEGLARTLDQGPTCWPSTSAGLWQSRCSASSN